MPAGRTSAATASWVAAARLTDAPRIRQRQEVPGSDTVTTSWRLWAARPSAQDAWDPPWNGSTNSTRSVIGPASLQ